MENKRGATLDGVGVGGGGGGGGGGVARDDEGDFREAVGPVEDARAAAEAAAAVVARRRRLGVGVAIALRVPRHVIGAS